MSSVARTAVAIYLSSCEQAKTSVIVEFLDTLHDCSRQCFLSDRQPPLNDADIACIANALKQPHHMRVLDLYSNDISSFGVTSLLSALVERPNVLRELRLGNVQMNDETAELIAETFAQNQIGLRVLDLSQNQITEVGCNALAQVFIGENSPVLELSLHSNSLGPGCAGAITRLALCDRIRHLHLGRNQLGDATAVELARALPRCRTISTLDLSENCIGFDGGRALAQALIGSGSAINNGVCLQRLNLRGNLLDADALTAFVRVVQENRNLTQLFVGCNEGQPSADQTQEILKALLENDVLLLLDIVGWPLPHGTAWDVADSILSSNTGVRAVVSDAFDDVFEYIDGANHDRTQRGQQSIYFGVNEYIGASAVAAATSHNSNVNPVSVKAPSGARSDSQNQSQQQQQQPPQLDDGLPPAKLESTSRSPDNNTRGAASTGIAEAEQQRRNLDRTSSDDKKLSGAQRPPLNQGPQQQKQQQQPNASTSSRNASPPQRQQPQRQQQQQQQQQRTVVNPEHEQRRLEDCEREVDEVIDNIAADEQQRYYGGGSSNNDNNNRGPVSNEGRMAVVLNEALASLRRAHERIAELERRDADKAREIENLKRGQQRLQQQQQQTNDTFGSRGGIVNNGDQQHQPQQQQQQQERFVASRQQQQPAGLPSQLQQPFRFNDSSVDNNNNNNNIRRNAVETPLTGLRRGEPGTPFQQQQPPSRSNWGNDQPSRNNDRNNNNNNNNNNNVPPLRLNNVPNTSNRSTHQQQQQRERSNSPVKGVSTTKGPGGSATSASSSSTYRDASPSDYNGRSESQSGGNQQPALHPYWKHTTPERARELESARDRPLEYQFGHAASIPHANNARDRTDQKGEDCPTPNLQHSVKVDPCLPLMHVPAPQTPPPRPTVPRATT